MSPKCCYREDAHLFWNATGMWEWEQGASGVRAGGVPRGEAVCVCVCVCVCGCVCVCVSVCVGVGVCAWCGYSGLRIACVILGVRSNT